MLSAIALCCFVVIVSRIEAAQARPDLSGTWTIARIPMPASVEGRGNTHERGSLRIGPAASSLIISQDAATITVDERYSPPPNTNKAVYRFDGMVRNRFRLTFDTVPSEVTSRWQDNKLVSSIVVFVPGEAEPRRYQQTLSLNASGFLLVRIEDGSSNARTLTYQK